MSTKRFSHIHKQAIWALRELSGLERAETPEERKKLTEELRDRIDGIAAYAQPPTENFPHGISCECCQEKEVCNRCGGPAPKLRRCTNGRCLDCCSIQCKHRSF